MRVVGAPASMSSASRRPLSQAGAGPEHRAHLASSASGEKGVERRGVRINREELLNRLVEEFREDAPRWPTPRDEKEEALLTGVETQLMNLRKKRVRRAGGEEIDVYERGENHFGFACAYAKLAEELAVSEGILAPPAGGTVQPPPEIGYRRLSRGR